MELSNVLTRALIEVAQHRGVAPEVLAGREPGAVFSEPADRRVPLEAFQAMLSRAVELTGEPALGLQVGLRASEASFGLIGPLVSHAQSLRHAIGLIAQFSGLIGDDLAIELRECAGSAQLRCKLHPEIGRAVSELIGAGLVRALWSFGCERAEIHAVCFEHKHPPHRHAYAVAFGGAERFGQAYTGVEFAAAALDRPHLHWQPELQACLHAAAERALEQLSRPLSYTERVRGFLGSRREPQAPDMPVAARELGLSVRSLRRRLEQEGTSYRELTQKRSFEWASVMLRNRSLTLQEIAYALGFTDSPSFHRAFRRWAGATPRAYRDAAGRGAVSASCDHHR